MIVIVMMMMMMMMSLLWRESQNPELSEPKSVSGEASAEEPLVHELGEEGCGTLGYRV